MHPRVSGFRDRDKDAPSRINGTGQHQPTNVGALAAHALTSTLANPYPAAHSYTNANYHGYFTQTHHPRTTPQGYTLSATYVSNAPGSHSQMQSTSWPLPQNHQAQVTNNTLHKSIEYSHATPGDTKCTHTGCSFTGSKRTVEIHMMDRHLIFPPGWKKRRSDWDADPSLKGKPVPIPGTGVTLNTPEAIDAWIDERKKKWPTNQRIEDKIRKVQEAENRGEIVPTDLTARRRKRKRVDDEWPQSKGGASGRGRDGRISRGHWRSRDTNFGLQRRSTEGHTRPDTHANATFTGDRREDEQASFSLDKDTPDSGSDMDPVKDSVSSKPPTESSTRILKQELGGIVPQTEQEDDPHIDEHITTSPASRTFRRQVAQPRMAPPNPFATRPSLLRNLLLPEIRSTVSNLSQAIHFLVENEFLEGVELKPGESDAERIKVLESSNTECSGASSDVVLRSIFK